MSANGKARPFAGAGGIEKNTNRPTLRQSVSNFKADVHNPLARTTTDKARSRLAWELATVIIADRGVEDATSREDKVFWIHGGQLRWVTVGRYWPGIIRLRNYYNSPPPPRTFWPFNVPMYGTGKEAFSRLELSVLHDEVLDLAQYVIALTDWAFLPDEILPPPPRHELFNNEDSPVEDWPPIYAWSHRASEFLHKYRGDT